MLRQSTVAARSDPHAIYHVRLNVLHWLHRKWNCSWMIKFSFKSISPSWHAHNSNYITTESIYLAKAPWHGISSADIMEMIPHLWLLLCVLAWNVITSETSTLTYHLWNTYKTDFKHLQNWDKPFKYVTKNNLCFAFKTIT